MQRFSVKSEATGYAIYDTETERLVVVGAAPQEGLTLADAETAAEILNQAHRAACDPPEL